MSNIELNVVALGDFKGLEAQLAGLQKQIQATNAQLNSQAATLTTKQMAGLSDAFHQAMMSSNLFTSKLISMSTAAEHLGERIQKTRTNMTDYKNAMKSVADQSNIYNQLGQRQVAMQEAIASTMGNGMARVYAQHNVDLSKASINSKVLTQAIIAQNAALMQGATKIINWGKNMQWAGRQLTAGLTMPVTLFAGALAKMYNEVDQNLTRLSRVYGVGLEKPTKAMLDSVRKDVIGLSKELGKELGISATEVTDTAAQFAAAGLTGEQLISATKQASRLVVLGETDKQEAIKATIALQTAYKLNTEETTNAVNFFNAAQAATSTSMTDLVEAIPRVGPIIEGLGGSYKDMVAILTALKEGGVPAGEAANAIKNSLGRIINPTKAAQASLKGFGIDINAIVNKNAGNLIGTLTDLQSGLDGLSSLDRQRAISELFGKFQFARMAAFMDNFNKTGSQSAKVVEMMGMSAADLAAIADEQTKKIQQSASGRFKIAVESLKNSLLPLGESALNIFTAVIEKVEKFFNSMQNLPGPVKSFIKIFGGLAIIAGPLIMITGLFGNLIGQFAKAAINARTLGQSILNIGNGVNPLKTLGSRFSVITEEMIAESNAAKIFGDSMSASVSPINAVTAALEALIAQMKNLNIVGMSSANAAVQRQAASMGAANATAYASAMNSASIKGGNLKGAEASHVVSKAQTEGLFKGIDLSKSFTTGETISGKESYSSPINRATTGTIMIESNSKLAGVQKELQQATFLVKDINAKLTMWDDVISKSATAQRLVADGIMTQDEIVNSLTMTWKEQILLEETYQYTLQQINAETKLGIKLKEIMNNKDLTAIEIMSQTNNLLETNKTAQKTILSRTKQKMSTINSEEDMISALNLYTKEEVSMAKKGALQSAGRYRTLRLIVQAHLTELELIQSSGKTDEQIAVAKQELLIAVEEQIAAVEQGTISEKIGNKAGKSRFSGGGMLMGAGMVGGIAGGMMMGSENKAMAIGGQSLMYGSMAAGILPMLTASMAVTGGLTALVAAIPLAIAGINYLKKENEKAAAALRGSLGATAEDFKALGVELQPLTNTLPLYDEKLGIAKTAVDEFTQSIRDASDTSTLKAFGEALKTMTNDQRRAALTNKAQSLAAGGMSQSQVAVAIQGYMNYAGMFESIQPYIESAFTASGERLGSVLSKSIISALSTAGGAGGFDQAGRVVSGLPNTDQYNAAVSSTATTIQAMLQNSDLESFITQVDQLTASMRNWSGASNASFALNDAIEQLTANSPDLSILRDKLIAAGKDPQEQLLYLRAAINGVGGSIENLPKMTVIQVKAELITSEAKSAASGIFSEVAKNAPGTPGSGSDGSGGSGNGNKAIDAQIEKNKELIDLIKKQMEERKKALELAQKELDFSRTKIGLENQIRDALASGNFLKAAELQNELAVVEAKKAQDDQQSALDAADQKRIDELEAKNKELEKKKGNGGSGGGSSSSADIKTTSDNLQAVADKALAATNNVSDLYLGLEGFKRFSAPDGPMKALIDKMKELGATPAQIQSALKEMYKSYTPTKEALLGSEEFATSFKNTMAKTVDSSFSPREWENKSKLATMSALTAAQTAVDKNKIDFTVHPELDNFSTADLAKLYKQLGKGFSGVGSTTVKKSAIGGIIGYANAGMVTGPGGGTADMVPAMLSNGEYVIRASSVSKYGKQVLDQINNGVFNIDKPMIPTFNMPGSPTSASPTSSTNNVIINADISVHGGNPKEAAAEVMKQLDMIQRKAGGKVRF